MNNCFRIIFLFFCFQSFLQIAHAQKKVDQVIPDAEKRKVLKAKKLFNEYKIYDGERILKELVREHPYEYYYHEALVQLQRQVLAQLRPAYVEYENYTNPSKKDSLQNENNDELSEHETRTKNQPIAKKDTVEVEWNGLDTGPRKEDKIKRKRQKEEEVEEPIMTEATVTIDSSLLKEDIIMDEDGAPIMKLNKRDRTLEKQLKAISELSQIPYDSYKEDLIRNARKATLQVEYADSASAYLREFLVDTLNPDMNIDPLALVAFENGYEEVQGDDLIAARKHLEKALEISPDYYSAHLVLGDTWYLIGKDSNAIVEYTKAGLLQPLRPEPLISLSLLNYQRGKFNEAAIACIQAIAVYPQQHYIQLLKRIVKKIGKDFNTQWMRREVYPLNPSQNYFELTAKENTPWWIYQAAEPDIHEFSDTSGILSLNEKTTERYLEVYAWKKILKDTANFELPFARAMNKMGFLDCYVLISCFHQDLYKQFSDFAKYNPERINEYFYILMNWEDKKFDKVRKEFAPKKKGEDKKKDKKIKEEPAKKEEKK